MITKDELRKSIKLEKSNLKEKIKNLYDERIYANLVNSDFYKKAKIIFVYVSFNNEVDTHKFIRKAFEDNKTVCVPKVVSKEKGMEAIKIDSFSDLKKGYYGILEPINNDLLIKESEIDLVILPGLVFDFKGGRIGYGGGFYDRFLKKYNNIFKIGLAYDFQLINSIPLEEHDILIDGIITQKNIYLFNLY